MSETNKHLNDTHVDANEEALQNNLVNLEKKVITKNMMNLLMWKKKNAIRQITHRLLK